MIKMEKLLEDAFQEGLTKSGGQTIKIALGMTVPEALRANGVDPVVFADTFFKLQAELILYYLDTEKGDKQQGGVLAELKHRERYTDNSFRVGVGVITIMGLATLGGVVAGAIGYLGMNTGVCSLELADVGCHVAGLAVRFSGELVGMGVTGICGPMAVGKPNLIRSVFSDIGYRIARANNAADDLYDTERNAFQKKVTALYKSVQAKNLNTSKDDIVKKNEEYKSGYAALEAEFNAKVSKIQLALDEASVTDEDFGGNLATLFAKFIVEGARISAKKAERTAEIQMIAAAGAKNLEATKQTIKSNRFSAIIQQAITGVALGAPGGAVTAALGGAAMGAAALVAGNERENAEITAAQAKQGLTMGEAMRRAATREDGTPAAPIVPPQPLAHADQPTAEPALKAMMKFSTDAAATAKAQADADAAQAKADAAAAAAAAAAQAKADAAAAAKAQADAAKPPGQPTTPSQPTPGLAPGAAISRPRKPQQQGGAPLQTDKYSLIDLYAALVGSGLDAYSTKYIIEAKVNDVNDPGPPSGGKRTRTYRNKMKRSRKYTR